MGYMFKLMFLLSFWNIAHGKCAVKYFINTTMSMAAHIWLLSLSNNEKLRLIEDMLRPITFKWSAFTFWTPLPTINAEFSTVVSPNQNVLINKCAILRMLHTVEKRFNSSKKIIHMVLFLELLAPLNAFPSA